MIFSKDLVRSMQSFNVNVAFRTSYTTHECVEIATGSTPTYLHNFKDNFVPVSKHVAVKTDTWGAEICVHFKPLH
jgi:hypothetical protein